MQRTMGLDVLECPRCSGRLRLIAVIDDPAVIQRILRHLGLPTGIPEARPARSPPMTEPVLGATPQVGPGTSSTTTTSPPDDLRPEVSSFVVCLADHCGP